MKPFISLAVRDAINAFPLIHFRWKPKRDEKSFFPPPHRPPDRYKMKKKWKSDLYKNFIFQTPLGIVSAASLRRWKTEPESYYYWLHTFMKTLSWIQSCFLLAVCMQIYTPTFCSTRREPRQPMVLEKQCWLTAMHKLRDSAWLGRVFSDLFVVLQIFYNRSNTLKWND